MPVFGGHIFLDTHERKMSCQLVTLVSFFPYFSVDVIQRMFQALSLDALRDKFRNMERQHLLQGEQFLFFLRKRIRKLKGAEL